MGVCSGKQITGAVSGPSGYSFDYSFIPVHIGYWLPAAALGQIDDPLGSEKIGALKKLKSFYRAAIESIDDRYVLHNIRHIHGNKPLPGKECEFQVVSLVRNGEEYIREFIDHYLKLGARHIFIIDNQSDDKTIEIAKAYDCVSIFSTELLFSTYEIKIRKCFLKHYFPKSWVLCVDIDEHFDFPRREAISMRDLLAYLHGNGFTAVTACMLDMFSVGAKDNTNHRFSSTYPYVNIGEITKSTYPADWLTRNNTVPHGICIYKNGIRRKALKTDHEFLLVKHPLLYISPEIIPFTHPHYCANAKIADLACVLLHYKFTEGFLDRAKRIAADPKTNPVWAKENRLYVEHFTKNGYISGIDQAYKYISASDLTRKDFLYVSDSYRNYLTGPRQSAAF